MNAKQIRDYYAKVIREALKEFEKMQNSESEMLCYKYKKFKKKHSKKE
jgi:hypothetical protein